MGTILILIVYVLLCADLASDSEFVQLNIKISKKISIQLSLLYYWSIVHFIVSI